LNRLPALVKTILSKWVIDAIEELVTALMWAKKGKNQRMPKKTKPQSKIEWGFMYITSKN
jgi:hypothetical protein